jgi:hypothetical protein
MLRRALESFRVAGVDTTIITIFRSGFFCNTTSSPAKRRVMARPPSVRVCRCNLSSDQPRQRSTETSPIPAASCWGCIQRDFFFSAHSKNRHDKLDFTIVKRLIAECLIVAHTLALDSYTPECENLSLTFMLPTVVTKNVIAPRRQARKERTMIISSNLGALCAFARVTVFPMSLIRN